MNNPGILEYFFVLSLVIIGIYILVAHGNLVRKIVGLNIIQTGMLILCITTLDSQNTTIQRISGVELFSPVPLYLTAIVIVAWGIITAIFGNNLVVRLRESYGTDNENEIMRGN